ncbi:hypothetical protein NPIL_394891 [Nephila pilipes]|uniref:Uncharacterized protein n=1 Tax=Nephila pilipes TaxID=299642 RepID=A0A8X6NC82_NEPPI|nr:hypothetical protein NPIL_394891 [Nephila pilipes]
MRVHSEGGRKENEYLSHDVVEESVPKCRPAAIKHKSPNPRALPIRIFVPCKWTMVFLYGYVNLSTANVHFACTGGGSSEATPLHRMQKAPPEGASVFAWRSKGVGPLMIIKLASQSSILESGLYWKVKRDRQGEVCPRNRTQACVFQNERPVVYRSTCTCRPPHSPPSLPHDKLTLPSHDPHP